MTDRPEPTYALKGNPATLEVGFSVEAWQLFAFVFAALTSLAFSVLR